MTAERRGPNWVIKTRDNGPGIAPKYQTRVLLPFTRMATLDVPGAGLGLAVCKRVVEELGGTIWIGSELGAGATFCLTIAAAEEGSRHR